MWTSTVKQRRFGGFAKDGGQFDFFGCLGPMILGAHNLLEECLEKRPFFSLSNRDILIPRDAQFFGIFYLHLPPSTAQFCR